MLNSIDSLKIITIFVIFFVSIAGFFLPFYYIKVNESSFHAMESDSFKILRGFSTGVIIGVAFLHLLPDSVSIPIILYPSEYNCKILYSFILFDIIFSYFLIVTYPLIVSYYCPSQRNLIGKEIL